jgi:hypothetical protein
MGLFTGATKIDAVYVGGAGGSTGSGEIAYSKVMLKYSDANRSARAEFGQAYPGDLLVLVMGNPTTSAPTAPSGWTLYKTIGSSGLGNTYSSSIYYKYATAGGTSSVNTPGITTDWMSFVFTGAHPTAPFGAYADVDHGTTNLDSYPLPAITMTQPNGFALVMSLLSGKSTVMQWEPLPPGYTAGLSQNYWNQWAILRTDRTTAAVPQIVQKSTSRQTAFSHTLELMPNFITLEPGIASAVYLGAEKVWPVVTGADTTFSIPGTFVYKVPSGAKKLDIVALGAGGGGGKGEWLGEGRGALPGQWAAVTLTVGLDVQIGQALNVIVGAGGEGNSNVLDLGPGKDGGQSTLFGFLTAKGGIGGGSSTSQSIGMPSISGGNPDPTNYVYNGKTYVAGVGGTSVGVPNFPGYGLNGNSPGVGGFGGDNITVGIAGGGFGGDGRVWIHAY